MARAGRDATNVLKRVFIRVFIYGSVGSAIATLTLGAVVVPRPAAAKPEFAAQTGFPCGRCHVSQTGGGQLKPFGEAYKANGYKLPKK